MDNSESKEVSHVYLHIGNGGVSLSVLDGKYGPSLLIESHHFGIRTNSMEVPTDSDSVVKLAEMFQVAAKHNYKAEPYVYAAKHWAPSSHNEQQHQNSSTPTSIIEDDDGDVEPLLPVYSLPTTSMDVVKDLE